MKIPKGALMAAFPVAILASKCGIDRYQEEQQVAAVVERCGGYEERVGRVFKETANLPPKSSPYVKRALARTVIAGTAECLTLHTGAHWTCDIKEESCKPNTTPMQPHPLLTPTFTDVRVNSPLGEEINRKCGGIGSKIHGLSQSDHSESNSQGTHALHLNRMATRSGVEACLSLFSGKEVDCEGRVSGPTVAPSPGVYVLECELRLIRNKHPYWWWDQESVPA